MPDITMCSGENCPKKNECHRYTAVPGGYMQSYFVTPPVDDEGECEYFMGNSKFEEPTKQKEP